MPERTVSSQAVNELLFPAINVLRGIELDIQDHPDCPYKVLAQKAVMNLMELLKLAKGEDNDERGSLQEDP